MLFSHFEITPFTQPKRFSKGIPYSVVGLDSSFHAAAKIVTTYLLPPQKPNTPIPVGIPGSPIDDLLNSVINTSTTL
jgi:hypothetical protein